MDFPLPTTPPKPPQNVILRPLTHSRFPREEESKQQQTTTLRTHTFSEGSIERQLGLIIPTRKPRHLWTPISHTLNYRPRQASSDVPLPSWHWKQRLDREKIGDDKAGSGEKGEGKGKMEEAKDSSTPESSRTSNIEYKYPPNPSQVRTKSYTPTTQQPAPTLSHEMYKQYMHLLEQSEEAWWWYCYFSTPDLPSTDLSNAEPRNLSKFFADGEGEDEDRVGEGRDSWDCEFCGGECFWRCFPFTY